MPGCLVRFVHFKDGDIVYCHLHCLLDVLVDSLKALSYKDGENDIAEI